MQVKQVDRVDAERLRRLLAVFNQVFRLAVARPDRLVTIPCAAQTDLGCHGDFLTRSLPRFQRLTHQFFAGLLLFSRRVVGPCGVDVAAACVKRGVQGFDADVVAAIVFDGQRHFTVADGGGVERSEITEQRHVFSFETGTCPASGICTKRLSGKACQAGRRQRSGVFPMEKPTNRHRRTVGFSMPGPR